MPQWVGLLHSVVIGKGRRVEMAALRAVAEATGLATVRTVVATGNLVFEGEGPADALEARLEEGFVSRFGRPVPIIVREAARWRRLVAGCPFQTAAADRGASVHVRVMRAPMSPERAAELERFRQGQERIALVAGDLWLHLPHGAGGSRLGAAAGAARMGVGTFRNWNTIVRIAAMLG